MTNNNALLDKGVNLYLRVFGRPASTNRKTGRFADLFADINGMAIIATSLYWLHDAIGVSISSPYTNHIIAAFMVFLILQRWLIFKGNALGGLYSFIIGIGAFWVALTMVAQTLAHTQILLLCLGIAFTTIAVGTTQGLMTFLAYSALIWWGSELDLHAGPHMGDYAYTSKQFFVATFLLAMLLAVCAILRQHYIDNTQAALKQRDDARRKLQDLLGQKTGQLKYLVAQTNQSFIKHEQGLNLRTMVSGLSHELCTPIGNAVLMASNISAWGSELEMESGKTSPRLRQIGQQMMEGAEIISRNLQKANELVAEFTQVGMDHVSNTRVKINLAECIRQSLFVLKPTIVKSRVAVKLHLDEDIQIDTFPFAIEQIVTNLVKNAMMHGLENKPNGVVTITTNIDPQLSLVAIQVEDNGIGIPKEVIGRIFEPFFTTKRGRGGSGMGLVNVRHLATTILSGEVHVESDTTGSIFTVIIPLVAPYVDQPPQFSSLSIPGELQ
jgi:signal transduction histidine kinase